MLKKMLSNSERQWRMLNHLRRKHKISTEFLHYSMPNILKLIAYYANRLRFVIRRCAVRRSNGSVVIKYNQLSRLLFDDAQRKRVLCRKRNVKQWSKRMVCYLRNTYGIEEESFIEWTNDENVIQQNELPPEEVTKQLKEQLELLKSGKRNVQLIDSTMQDQANNLMRKTMDVSDNGGNNRDDVNDGELILNERTGFLEDTETRNMANCIVDLSDEDELPKRIPSPVVLNEKTGFLESTNPHSITKFRANLLEEIFEATEPSPSPCNIAKFQENLPKESPKVAEVNPTPFVEMLPKSKSNFLDILMSKVRVGAAYAQENHIFKTVAFASTHDTAEVEKQNRSDQDTTLDSGEEFLGFEEHDGTPGMMLTPLVPLLSRSKDENVAFVSESLDEYFRENPLERKTNTSRVTPTSFASRKVRQSNIDGLVTPACVPPFLQMPAVPEALQKLRTVAERRLYLQRASRNRKLAIINNEANIYRELQRKIRQPKLKITSQQALQAANSNMAFTRQGWQAASFIATEFNRFYLQKLMLENSKDCVRLCGVRGNNCDQYKMPYTSCPTLSTPARCDYDCLDRHIASSLQPLVTFASKKKLNQHPLRPLFKPCPLSQKPFQRPTDEDAAEILLTGGSMAVVRLPTVEMMVYPEVGKPFNEIAKRYLQYIMPYQDITREWAEFSVSTVRSPSVSKMQKAKRRKSFIFAIPYVNDRSQILVRRIVDRSEQLDPIFQRKSEKACSLDFNFRKKLKPQDTLAMECADILADMINSVAISCSENSFTKIDADGCHTERETKTESLVEPTTPKRKLNTQSKINAPQKTEPKHQQKRLILELRRLNATIIDTQAQPNDDTPLCSNKSCVLGCICASLSQGYSDVPKHCGKIKCMFECACDKSKLSQNVVLDVNGRSITAEDAIMMRQHATARLARMEKEFTSTVVVTEKETLLINESQYEKKRRCTKLPKRYEDFSGDDYQQQVSPVKSNSDYNEPTSSLNSSYFERNNELREPIYVKDYVLKQLKHCTVPLVSFNETQNMAVWCMIHQLYKCFCGGHAIDGKRIVIEKGDTNMTTTEDTEATLRTVGDGKTRYTFDKTEMLPFEADASGGFDDTNNYNDSLLEPIVHDVGKSTSNRTKRPSKDFLTTYYKNNTLTGCCRFIPVPANFHKYANHKRRGAVLNFIKCMETESAQLLLNEHIMRSVYYHKEMRIVEAAERMAREQGIEIKQEPTEEGGEAAKASAAAAATFEQHNLKRAAEDSTTTAIASKRFRTNDESNIESVETTENKFMQLPRISGCYSLGACIDENIKTAASNAGTTEQPATSFPMQPLTGDTISNALSENWQKNYNEVIKALNVLVSKKMNDIDNALRLGSKIVPPPSEGILCVLQWINFHNALEDGLIYIWEVKMKTRTFYAGTVNNVLPMVHGAHSVINIQNQAIEHLPLFARMLRYHIITPNTKDLAIIMQGRQLYWLIKGFFRTDTANACLRPTPSTHPKLTQKINNLCSVIIRQRMKSARKLERRRRNFMEQNIETIDLDATTTTVTDATATTSNSAQQSSVTKKSTESLLKTFLQAPRELTTATTTSTNQLDELSGLVDSIKTQNDDHGLPPPAKRLKSDLTNTVDTQPTSVTTAVAPAPAPADIFNDLKRHGNLRKSNIAIRKATIDDIADVQQPEFHARDHRWFVVDMQNDFSHIFVPEQREIVSLDRIQRLMWLANEKEKVIQIQFVKRASFDAFIVPRSKRKIYFGPFPLKKTAPVLVLLQSVDGNMMTRETYQYTHGIQAPMEQRTTAFWMSKLNGEYIFDEDSSSKSPINKTTAATGIGSTNTNVTNEAATDEENCVVIIDDDDADDNVAVINEAKQRKLTEMTLTQALPTRPLPSTGFLGLGMNMSLEKGTIDMAAASSSSSSALPLGRLNFTIQTTGKTNKLKITATECEAMTSAETPTATTTTNKPMNILPALQLPTQATALSVSSTSSSSSPTSTLSTSLFGRTVLISTLPQPTTSTPISTLATPVKNATTITTTIPSNITSSTILISDSLDQQQPTVVKDANCSNLKIGSIIKLLPLAKGEQQNVGIDSDTTVPVETSANTNQLASGKISTIGNTTILSSQQQPQPPNASKKISLVNSTSGDLTKLKLIDITKYAHVSTSKVIATPTLSTTTVNTTNAASTNLTTVSTSSTKCSNPSNSQVISPLSKQADIVKIPKHIITKNLVGSHQLSHQLKAVKVVPTPVLKRSSTTTTSKLDTLQMSLPSSSSSLPSTSITGSTLKIGKTTISREGYYKLPTSTQITTSEGITQPAKPKPTLPLSLSTTNASVKNKDIQLITARNSTTSTIPTDPSNSSATVKKITIASQAALPVILKNISTTTTTTSITKAVPPIVKRSPITYTPRSAIIYPPKNIASKATTPTNTTTALTVRKSTSPATIQSPVTSTDANKIVQSIFQKEFLKKSPMSSVTPPSTAPKPLLKLTTTVSQSLTTLSNTPPSTVLKSLMKPTTSVSQTPSVASSTLVSQTPSVASSTSVSQTTSVASSTSAKIIPKTADTTQLSKVNDNPAAKKSSKSLNTIPTYGHFRANTPGFPTFPTKRNLFEYLIKVPGTGVVKTVGLEGANNYLNLHIAKIRQNTNSQNLVWSFIPLKRNTTETTSTGENNDSVRTKPVNQGQSQAPTLKTRMGVSAISKTAFKAKERRSKLFVNAVAAKSTNIHLETILIDD